MSETHQPLLCRHIHHLPFSPQAEAGELVLKILERSGLIRSQQGAALMLTVHGIATEMKMDDIANMTCANLADLYTVSNPKAVSLPCVMRMLVSICPMCAHVKALHGHVKGCVMYLRKSAFA